jgi:hypothetical protein
MALNQKHVFWEALIISIFIFGIGFVFGMFLENSRSNEMIKLYLSSETNLLDIQVFSEIIQERSVDCNNLIEKNIEFGDQIYSDALRLEKYEEARKITPEIIDKHRKYDLLRTIFWLNSVKIKEKCPGFHTVVYLYDYQTEDLTKRARQTVFSRYLGDLKEEFGNEILLIPIAKNMNLISLDILIADYGLSGPAIIIDEKLVIESENSLDKIREYLQETQNSSTIILKN